MSLLSNYLAESLLKELDEQTIVLFPGGFKPPHGGHLELATRYSQLPNVSQVMILVGPEPREGITREQSIAIWRELTKSNNKILIQKTEVNSPLAAAYKYIETAKPGSYALAASSKGDDYKRVQQFVAGHQSGAKYAREGVNVVELPLDVKPLPYQNRTPKAEKYAPGKSENNKGVSASVLRADLKNDDKEAFATNYPNVANKAVIDKVYGILKKKASESLNEDKLRVFDFDDTLVHTNSKIHITKRATGEKITMTPAEYAVYDEQEGDVFDFSEFSGPIKSAKEFKKYTNVMRAMLNADGNDRKVVVLTARADSKSVEDYLKTIGIQAPVIGVGSSDPYKKSQWIEDQIAQGYDDVYFLDDSTKNLAAVDQLKAKYPNVKIRTQNVLQPNTAVPTTEEILPSDFFSKLKMRFKDFIKKVSQEKDETKEAFAMIVQAAQGKKNLTPAERKAVGDQLGDVIKTMGLGAASILPGGVIYFTLIKLLKLEKYTMPSSFVTEKVNLNEGGGAGHLAHPYEDLDLTFTDIKDMIKAALSGKLEYAQEKLDGQNLMVTYKDGKVRSARNKTELKNFGQESKTIDQVAEKFANRGPIKTAFVETMRDLENAINKLTPEQKEQFFQNGKRFINLEILFPETQNVIPYGAALLRMHHFKEYDQAGTAIKDDVEGVQLLQTAFDGVQSGNDEKTFEVGVTNPATIKQDADYDAQEKEFLAMADAVRQKYKMQETNTVKDYVGKWWNVFVKKKANELGYQIPKEVRELIVNRWAFTDKSIPSPAIKAKIANEEFKNWFDQFDKSGEVEVTKKEVLQPVERLFLKLGVRILKNIENLTTVNPNDATKKIKQDVAAAIKGIQTAVDSDTIADSDAAMKFLKNQLLRLKDIGGFEAIVPTEGVVFRYKGKLYKLTGAFAPVNQILGYLRF
jgi:hypothetical protein